MTVADKIVTDCGDDGCGVCDVCQYLNFLENAQACAPIGESVFERDDRIERYLTLKYPHWNQR